MYYELYNQHPLYINLFTSHTLSTVFMHSLAPTFKHYLIRSHLKIANQWATSRISRNEIFSKKFSKNFKKKISKNFRMDFMEDMKSLVAKLAMFKEYREQDYRQLRIRLQEDFDNAVESVIADYQNVGDLK